ncbi:MAG: ABC transporter permease [Bacteroidetes bacterium]|nr:ABC transporter permease [Bacteroidota bacterium]MBS1930941.1 ABC transporter permease [Bacteroidota bacterium]
MFKNYFKIAFRNLRKNRVYGSINVLGLALSMACCILIFTLVKYHLSFDNFHKNADRIYRFVTEQQRDQISYAPSVPPPFGKAFRTDYDFAEDVARIVTFRNALINIKERNEEKKFKETEGVSYAEPEFFNIFNFPLLQGDKKTALTEPNTAVITEHLAKKYFGTTDVINKTFRYENRDNFKITGVLKDIPSNTDLKSEIYLSWVSLIHSQNDWYTKDDAWGGISTELQCYALLKPNVSIAQVEKLLPAYVTKYRADSKNVHHYKLQPLADVHFDARYNGVMEKRNLWILSFIGLFLIITACVNFINLATAQALKRAKEVGIRKVLGSLRGQLFWQFIAETALITIMATVVAIGLSYLALPSVNEWFKTQMSIHIFSDILMITFLPLLALVVIFLAGSYPGLILSGFRPVSALKGKLSQQHIGGFNTRRTLIVTQFAISLMLIIGMIVITQQMRFAKKSDLGFNKDAIVMIPTGYDSASKATKALQNELAAIPGVQTVSQCSDAPSSQNMWATTIKFDTRTESELFRTSIKAGDDQYLKTFDMQLAAGRNIFPSDSVRELLVNQTLVKKLGLQSPEEALGKKIFFNGDISGTIAGVVKDFHDGSFHEDINATLITTYTDNYNDYAVKINMNKIKSVLPALEKKWNSFHPGKIYEYQFLDEQISEFYETEGMMLKLITAFSLIAIFIGCLGLYGLVSFMAAQKTKEIGIRKVLGSSVAEILWIFGKEFGSLITIAFVVAAPIAWWLMNSWLQDFKYRISIGIGVFVLAIAIILFIAMATVAYQSIKAAMANPVKSLRTE